MIIQKVLSGNRITIPEETRQKLDLKIGDLIKIEIIDRNRLKITPLVIVPRPNRN